MRIDNNLNKTFADFSLSDETLKWLAEQNKDSNIIFSFTVVHLIGSGFLLGAGIADTLIQTAAAVTTLFTGAVAAPIDGIRYLAGKPPLLKAWSWKMTIAHTGHAIKHVLNLVFIVAENFFVGPERTREDFFKSNMELERAVLAKQKLERAQKLKAKEENLAIKAQEESKAQAEALAIKAQEEVLTQAKKAQEEALAKKAQAEAQAIKAREEALAQAKKALEEALAQAKKAHEEAQAKAQAEVEAQAKKVQAEAEAQARKAQAESQAQGTHNPLAQTATFIPKPPVAPPAPPTAPFTPRVPARAASVAAIAVPDSAAVAQQKANLKKVDSEAVKREKEERLKGQSPMGMFAHADDLLNRVKNNPPTAAVDQWED